MVVLLLVRRGAGARARELEMIIDPSVGYGQWHEGLLHEAARM